MSVDFDHVDITSPNNRWIRLARSLHRRRQRYRERAILVEGVHPLLEALRANVEVTVVLLDSSVPPDHDAAELASAFAKRGVLVQRVDPDPFHRAADTESPQGILAVAPFPSVDIRSPHDSTPLFLIADRIRDPGNLGTLIRSAQGAGVHAVFIAPECVDPYSPKVIRAAMGSHFHVPIAFLDWTTLPSEVQATRVFAAEMTANVRFDLINWQAPSSLIVGNEAAGLSDGARRAMDETVGIPLANNLESLNAAVAGSVILFEAARQRRKGLE